MSSSSSSLGGSAFPFLIPPVACRLILLAVASFFSASRNFGRFSSSPYFNPSTPIQYLRITPVWPVRM